LPPGAGGKKVFPLNPLRMRASRAFSLIYKKFAIPPKTGAFFSAAGVTSYSEFAKG
jgi:hypothetical protein